MQVDMGKLSDELPIINVIIKLDDDVVYNLKQIDTNGF